jgi:hypothetical protein
MYRALALSFILLGCAPQAGPSGSLVRLDDDPGCPAGGTAILVGNDTNGNGELDQGEVLDSRSVCNGQDGQQGPPGQDGQGATPLGPNLVGSFVISNTSDLAAFQGVQTMTGNLGISVAGLSNISLPNLVSLQGQLAVNLSAGTTSVSFPGLTSVGSLQLASNPNLTSINFPALTSVGSFVSITNNSLLPTCQAQALVAQLSSPPPGGVTISGNNDAGICP